ncbi:hypothetical protein D9M70_516860 [compost metagenome]
MTTVGSIGWMLRETIDCSAMMIEAPQTIGSAVSCGSAPCPPRPCTVMRASSTAAMIGPSLRANWPKGRPGSLWSANTASQGNCSNSPSSIMILAPPKFSSAGWKIKWIVPSKLRRSASARAAPSSMAVWPS